jgi:two-component system LytT family response regulator
MFEREKNKKNTIVHCDNKKINTSESLSTIEGKLDGTNLLRISRSYIVNPAKIDSVLFYSESSYLVRFKNCGCEAYISKKTAQELALISK